MWREKPPLLHEELIGSGSTDPGMAYTNALLHAHSKGMSHPDCQEIAQAESDRVRRERAAERDGR